MMKTAWRIHIAQEQMEVAVLIGAARKLMRMKVELRAMFPVAGIAGRVVAPRLEARSAAQRQLSHAAPSLRHPQGNLHRIERGLLQALELLRRVHG